MMRIKKYIYYGIKRSNPNKILFIDVNLVVDNYNTVLLLFYFFLTYIYLSKHKYNKTYKVPHKTTQDEKYVQKL